MSAADHESPPNPEPPKSEQDGSRKDAPRAIAVALQDDPDTPTAPRITAAGKGKVAEQILAIAFANGVKVREDADLAQILSLLEVESVVPLEALAAVAEILRYVYMANARMAPPEAAL